MCGQRADFEKLRARIEEVRNPLPWRHLAARRVALLRRRTPAFRRSGNRRLDLGQRRKMRGAVCDKLGAVGPDRPADPHVNSVESHSAT